MSYMSYNDDTWHSYALQLQLTWHSTWGLMTLAFFDQKLENFAIPRNTDIDCIWTHNSFNFFWVFKGFFNKHDWNFDDVIKIDYCKSS